MFVSVLSDIEALLWDVVGLTCNASPADIHETPRDPFIDAYAFTKRKNYATDAFVTHGRTEQFGTGAINRVQIATADGGQLDLDQNLIFS